MEVEHDEPLLIEERRLIKTMLSGKPHPSSFIAAFSTFLVMSLTSSVYWNNTFGWAGSLPAVKREVFYEGEWWRVFTAIFIHADLGHFLSNMYMLSIFSFFVFGYFGLKVYPLLSLLSAGAVNVLAISTYSAEVKLVGASGLVYLLGGFWLTLYFLIQRQYNILNRLLRVTGIGVMIFFPTSFVPTTSYRTHAIGFAIGILMGFYYFSRNRKRIRSYEIYQVSYV